MKSLDRLKNHPRVMLVDDERDIGNGIIITLKPGFHYDAMDVNNRVFGEDTVTAALAALKMTHVAPADAEILYEDGDEEYLPEPR